MFERTRPLGDSKSTGGEFYPKFLSDQRLFDLQLVDPRWREVILVEFSIFAQHLLAYSSKEVHKPPSAKSLSVSLVTADQVIRDVMPSSSAP